MTAILIIKFIRNLPTSLTVNDENWSASGKCMAMTIVEPFAHENPLQQLAK